MKTKSHNTGKMKTS